MNTVRAMYDGTPERVDLPLIDKVVDALTELTGEPMTAADVLSWEAPADEEGTLLASGMADLSAELAEIEKDIDPQELNTWLAAFEGASA